MPTVLRLELDVGTDPIRGSLSAPDGRTAHFLGWLQLVAALERAHECGLASLPDLPTTAQ